jgi:hypothetical protein
MTSYVHELKTDHEPFAAVFSGEKTHEIRSAADRDFKVGDTLVLKETRYSADEMRRDGRPLEFTGRTASRIVTHIQRGYGLPFGVVVMSLANPSDKQEIALAWARAKEFTVEQWAAVYGYKFANPRDKQEAVNEARDRILEQSKNSLFRSGVKIMAAEVLSPTEQCDKPPEGWSCSRIKGHEGPCAAAPLANPSDKQEAGWWKPYAAAADAVSKSADVWQGFAIQDAKVCIDAYLAAIAAPLAQSSEQDRIDAEQVAMRKLLAKVPLPPNTITFEKGWELIDELQRIAKGASK